MERGRNSSAENFHVTKRYRVHGIRWDRRLSGKKKRERERGGGEIWSLSLLLHAVISLLVWRHDSLQLHLQATHTHTRPFSISANKGSRLSPEMFALDEALSLALSLIESSFFTMKRTAESRHSKSISRHFALTQEQHFVWSLSGIPHTGSAWNTVRSCIHILRQLQWALTFEYANARQHFLT